MEGMAPGDSRDIEVAFPADYGPPSWPGRQARLRQHRQGAQDPASRARWDDELAKAVGMENLEELKKAIRESMQREYDALSRLKLKRALLDQLAERADFAVPEGMVEAEFAQIWQRVEADLKAGRLDEEDKGKDEDALKADYRTIAARRIRLGLLLSEIGRVTTCRGAAGLANAVRQEAARYPGQEQQVREILRQEHEGGGEHPGPAYRVKVGDLRHRAGEGHRKRPGRRGPRAAGMGPGGGACPAVRPPSGRMDAQVRPVGGFAEFDGGPRSGRARGRRASLTRIDRRSPKMTAVQAAVKGVHPGVDAILESRADEESAVRRGERCQLSIAAANPWDVRPERPARPPASTC